MKSIPANEAERKSAKKGAFEHARDDFQKQMIADPEITLGFLRVAIALSLNFNRKEFNSGNGLVAFPGIERTLAPLTGLSTRTVIRAIKWFEARGHMRIERRRSGKKNLVNRYHPLRKTVAQLNEVPKAARVSPPSDTGCQGVVTPNVTLLSDLPSDLPLTLYKNIASIGMEGLNNSSTGEGSEVDFRDRETVESQHSIESPPSLEAQCYAEAREIPGGERNVGIVAKALKIDAWPAADVLEIILGVKADGGGSNELAHALWTPE
jgi:hypothetical protein